MNSFIKKIFNQPLLLLGLTQLGESFSFFGMRTLLVLYLIQFLKYQGQEAFAIYASYIAFIELSALAGGYLADRYFGLTYAILLGSIFICLGHICLAFSEINFLFFFGLSLIICGAGLFRGNLNALAGLLYNKNESQQEAGFTFLYTCVNLGGFTAAVACGFLAHYYNWAAGLSLAALGMFISFIIFFLNSRQFRKIEENALSCKGLTPIKIFTGILLIALSISVVIKHAVMTQVFLLPLAIFSLGGLGFYLKADLSFKSILIFYGLLSLLIFYFMIEELMGSLLMIFSENHVNRFVFGFEVPSSGLVAINPLSIMLMGPFLTYLGKSFSLKILNRLALVYACLSLSCAALYLSSASLQPTLLAFIISFFFLALGELLLVPTIFTFCAQLGSQKQQGVIMATVSVAFAVAGLLSGQMSQFVDQTEVDGLAKLMGPLTVLSSSLCICFICYSMISSRSHTFYKESNA